MANKVDELYQKLNTEAEKAGYHLNPDVSFTKDLVTGLITNIERYGYQNCPCRLASGIKKKDLDIICPCDYRDPDLNDYSSCFCGLYVSKEVINNKKSISSIPDRRLNKMKDQKIEVNSKLSYPVWRCKVCGYLMSADSPPETCPICHADKDRFERFA